LKLQSQSTLSKVTLPGGSVGYQAPPRLIRLSVCPSVRLSVCPSVRLSVCPSVRLSICPSVRLSVCPSVRLSVCPSVRLSVCPSVRLSVCPSVRLSVCRYRMYDTAYWLTKSMYHTIFGLFLQPTRQRVFVASCSSVIIATVVGLDKMIFQVKTFPKFYMSCGIILAMLLLYFVRL
jgi:hypothetical protein